MLIMNSHAVVIAGGGPTGLMLAGELALADVDVVVVERRTGDEVVPVRSRGMLSRSVEVLDQRGIADRIVSAGQTYPGFAFAHISLPIDGLATRHNYTLGLAQPEFERILAEWVVDELGVQVLHGREVVDFKQDEEGVDVALSDGESLRAQYMVGCDGGRSLVRKTAGIAFVGLDASTSFLIAELDLDEPELGMRPEGGGIGPATLGQTGGPFGAVVREQSVENSREPTLDDLRQALVARYGTDFGARNPKWISRFTDAARQAESYRAGRVFVAGDAAHVHSPQGGQGLQTGVQDAVNLGWKLAQVLSGTSPDTLLDTYHAERHPVGERVLRNVKAIGALSESDDRHQALRDTMSELLAGDGPRLHMAAMLSGLDIHYDLGEGHPLLGRRMPDLDLQTTDGPTRVFELLHDARPVLLHFAPHDEIDASAWPRLKELDATYDGTIELPIVGEVSLPAAVLIRPDGYVGWTAA